MRRVGAHAVASSAIEIGLDRSVIQAAEPTHFSRSLESLVVQGCGIVAEIVMGADCGVWYRVWSTEKAGAQDVRRRGESRWERNQRLRIHKGRHEEVSSRMGGLEADQHGWGR